MGNFRHFVFHDLYLQGIADISPESLFRILMDKLLSGRHIAVFPPAGGVGDLRGIRVLRAGKLLRAPGPDFFRGHVLCLRQNVLQRRALGRRGYASRNQQRDRRQQCRHDFFPAHCRFLLSVLLCGFLSPQQKPVARGQTQRLFLSGEDSFPPSQENNPKI